MTNEALSKDSDQLNTSEPAVSETDEAEVPPVEETTTQPITKVIPHDHHLGEN
jgi:hypothetical protein